MCDARWPLNFAKISDPNTIIVDSKTLFNLPNTCSRGVAVAVFPLMELDNVKTSRILRISAMRDRMFLNQRGYYRGFKKLFLNCFKLLKIDEEYFRKQLMKIEEERGDNNYVGCPISPYKSSDRYKKEWFNQYALVEFENQKLRAPIKYKNVLMQLYGNYMTPHLYLKDKILHMTLKLFGSFHKLGF